MHKTRVHPFRQTLEWLADVRPYILHACLIG